MAAHPAALQQHRPWRRLARALAFGLATVPALAPAAGATDCSAMAADLGAMRHIDQALRERAMASATPDAHLLAQLALVDRSNTRRLSAWLGACGWPTVRRDGQRASDDAWLLAQHADHDRPFQHRALRLLEAAVKTGDARGGHLAYLSDRLAIDERRPQLYGTQFKLEGCRLELLPIDSRSAVNERRAGIPGMPTLEAYEAEVRLHALPPECAVQP